MLLMVLSLLGTQLDHPRSPLLTQRGPTSSATPLLLLLLLDGLFVCSSGTSTAWVVLDTLAAGRFKPTVGHPRALA